MIRKPAGAERESSAHAAVGRAIEIGGEIREVSNKGGMLLSKGCLFIYFVPMLIFGVVTSDTPIWFKALLLMLGYGAFRIVRSASRRVRFEAEEAARARELAARSGSPLSGFHGGSGF